MKLFQEARHAVDNPNILVTSEDFRRMLAEFLILHQPSVTKIGTDIVDRARGFWGMSKFGSEDELYAAMRTCLRECANEISKLRDDARRDGVAF